MVILMKKKEKKEQIDGPMYCVWEVKDGVSATNFQDYLDSPGGVESTGCKTINNVVMKVDLELTGGVPPYERKFA